MGSLGTSEDALLTELVLQKSGALMKYSDIEDRLMLILNFLQDDSRGVNRCDELSEIVDDEIPLELCNLLHSSEIASLVSSEELPRCILWYYDISILSYNELISQYKNKSRKLSFFKHWGVDEDFRVNGFNNDGNSFFIESDINGELEFSIEVENVKSFIPIIVDDTYYILYGLGDKLNLHGLYNVWPSDSLANLVAPSLVCHIKDLIEGLKSGIYFIRDNELIYPEIWSKRQKLVQGVLTWEDFGDNVK